MTCPQDPAASLADATAHLQRALTHAFQCPVAAFFADTHEGSPWFGFAAPSGDNLASVIEDPETNVWQVQASTRGPIGELHAEGLLWRPASCPMRRCSKLPRHSLTATGSGRHSVWIHGRRVFRNLRTSAIARWARCETPRGAQQA